MSGLKVSTYTVPCTAVPAGPVGLRVILMVRVAPGAMKTGVAAGPATVCCQKSPVSEETHGSNGAVRALAEIFAVPAGEPFGNGPTDWTSVPQVPIASWLADAVSVTAWSGRLVASASFSGAPLRLYMSRSTGSEAVTVEDSLLVCGGTR